MTPDCFQRPPVSQRRGIPFFYDKSEEEFRQDAYERYDELVTRQTALHLADDLHGSYPFQPLLDYLAKWLPNQASLRVADIGCSVGRLAAEMAIRQPSWEVHGLDLSYQMLRQARDYWVLGNELRPRLMRYGFGAPTLQHPAPQPKLHLSLATAEDLPFARGALDVLTSTFLLDRLTDPTRALAEFHRALRPGGRLIVATPLNFLTAAGWRNCHPPIKLLSYLRRAGWQLLDWQDPFPLHEPMDARGNTISWNCISFVAERSEDDSLA